MSPAEFLTALWGQTPPGPVLVWTLPDKRSRWYRTFDTVNVDLRQLEHHDIYLEMWPGTLILPKPSFS